MRHLDRAQVDPPPCLSRFRAPANRWEELTWADREEIRTSLAILQRNHCAYCECDLANERKTPHIEHFELRSHAPQKTFDWTNLFWSCSHKEHCGVGKERRAVHYDARSLVKPDVDDPRRYLRFTSDGEVFPRDSLDERSRRRAETTIWVLALDHQSLVAARKAYLAGPYQLAKEAMEAGLTDDERRQWLDDEARAYEASAFSAAILDVLGVAP